MLRKLLRRNSVDESQIYDKSILARKKPVLEGTACLEEHFATRKGVRLDKEI